MNNFDNNYKKYYSKIKAGDSLKKKILDNTIDNKKTIRAFPKTLKMLTISLVLCFTIICAVFGVNAVKKLYYVHTRNSDKGTTCIIPNAILNVKNKNALFELSSKDKFTVNEIENILNVKFLNNSYLNDQIKEIQVEGENNLLHFAYFKRNTVNAIDIYGEKVMDRSTIDVSMTFITEDAPDDKKKIRSSFDGEDIDTYSVFETTNCNDKNMDIYYIDSLNTNLYIYKYVLDDGYYPYSNKSLKLEFNLFGFMEYDNILYYFRGSYMNRDLLVDFVKQFK